MAKATNRLARITNVTDVTVNSKISLVFFIIRVLWEPSCPGSRFLVKVESSIKDEGRVGSQLKCSLHPV